MLLELVLAAAFTGLLVHYASPSKTLLAVQTANVRLALTFVPLIPICMQITGLQLKIPTDCHILVFDNASTDSSPQAIATHSPRVDLRCSAVDLPASAAGTGPSRMAGENTPSTMRCSSTTTQKPS